MGKSILITDVESIIRRLQHDTGLFKDIKRGGNNIMCTCPFHNGGTEKNPSMGVLTGDIYRNGKLQEKGTYHCFTCGETGSIEELVSRVFGKLDGGYFGKQWIAKNFVSVSVEERQKLNLNLTREKQTNIIDYVTEEELASYRFYHPYHKKRGLSDRVVDYFDLGYDPKTGTMTMPVRDMTGNTVFVYRRSVEGKFFNNEAGTPRGSYVYGMYETIKNASRIDELLVCESPIDALTAWSNSKYAVATFTAQITSVQAKLIEKLPIRKIVSAYDNDDAGIVATRKLYKMLNNSKLFYRLQFPKYAKDLNDIKPEDWGKLTSEIFI